MFESHDRSVVKGAVAGLVAGFVASWVMNQFQAALMKASEPRRRPRHEDDATMKAAAMIAATVADRRLTKKEKKTAGPVVHYVFGSLVGAVYGALGEVARPATSAWGLPFSAALWLGADEVAVPALGLSKPPQHYPASTHASALAAHFVYGLTTDFVRRAVRTALP
jgi:uncharacterized membrane protein YagU involved in acid resistance